MTLLDFQERPTRRHAHRALFETRSARSGGIRRWIVSWREETRRCHGQDVVFVEDYPPVVDFDPHSDGGLTALQSQCGSCGTVISARVKITEAPADGPEHLPPPG